MRPPRPILSLPPIPDDLPQAWWDALLNIVKVSQEYTDAAEAHIDRLEADVPPIKLPSTLPLVATLPWSDWVALHDTVAALTGLPGDKVEMDDTKYLMPIGKGFWYDYWALLLPTISALYEELNFGVDCEDLARAGAIITRFYGKPWSALPIGEASVVTSGGTSHATNCVVWLEGQELCWGLMDFNPKGLFAVPPPDGVFQPQDIGWTLDKVWI